MKAMTVVALRALLCTGVLAAFVPATAAAREIVSGRKVSTVYGEPVGVIVSVEGSHFVLRTNKYDARLPVTSISSAGDFYLIAMNQDEVNKAVEAALGVTTNQSSSSNDPALWGVYHELAGHAWLSDEKHGISTLYFYEWADRKELLRVVLSV